MTIVTVQKPDNISISGNLKELILQSADAVEVKLSIGATVLLQETYYPGNGNLIHVDFTDVVTTQLSFALPSSDVFMQTGISKDFKVEYTGTAYTFRCIRSGKMNLTQSATAFLTENFLTWQPNTKPVTFYSPEWLTYFAPAACQVRLKAYWEDKTNTVITLASPSAGSCYTFNVQYAVISGKFSGKRPMYYDVWVESGDTRLSYVQRYVASEQQGEDEQWYLFENSLGGLDSLRAYGALKDEPEYTHNIANFGDQSEEFRIDVLRMQTRNTGNLTPDEARWLQDMFPSPQKYLYSINGLYPIVFTGGDASADTSKLPDSYTFTYRLADTRPYLDIQRRTDLPANLVIPIPTGETFFLPPRLAEFPKPTLSADLLLPVQEPHTEVWGGTTIGAVHDSVLNSLVKELDGLDLSASGGGSTLEIIESTEPVDKATEKNVFSALASLVHFLRKDAPDQTSHLLKLLGGVITDNITSQGFTEGALGSGLTIRRDPETGRSYIEVDELFVRMKAIFKELVIQKLSHVGGEIILSPARMKCVRVEDLVDRYRCYFEKTDGDREINNEYVVGDQARCQTFNVKVGINHNVSNSYYWRLVIGTGDDFVDLSKTDCDTSSTVPTAGDDIVQLGNRTDKDRQSAIILSAYGSNAPSFTQYNGISSYSLAGKEINMIGKESRFTGKVTIGAGSGGLGNLDEWPDAEDAINEANKKGDDAIGKAQSAQDYIDITLPVELRNLQDQIDGQVQAFFEGYNPTPANYPASEWTTDEIRATHGNDTFTNTLNGSSWRWSKVGNTWQWVEIIDAEVKEALRLAGLAKDTADGKRRVFITTPYTPYDSGDLWTQGSSGDVMRCIKSRTTGVYEPADWDKASKYTDDTAANKAQELADALNAKVNDMASDNKLTGVEKQNIKKEWNIINSEFPVLISQANAFGISVDSYKGAYYNLVNYLNIVMRSLGEPIVTMSGENLTTVSGVQILTCGPINLETTNDINGEYFRAVFKTYSDTKLALNKAVSDTIDNSTKENKKEILEVNKALGLFQDDVNGAFKDGIISKAEVDLIASHINTLNVEKKDVDAGYAKIMENVYLAGTAKTNLSVYKGMYDVAHDNLITSINTAIADGQATRDEQVDVNNKFVAYGNALAGYQTKLVEANKAIQDKLKTYSDTALVKANEAFTAAGNAQASANQAKESVTSLNNYVDGAFEDGVISQAEAKAIEKYLNTVKTSKADVEATYNKLYVNAYLEGTAKTGLLNAKVTLFGTIDILLSSINTAISDGKTTSAEKTDVDNKFTAFSTALASFNTAVEAANKAIQDKLKTYSDAAQDTANSADAKATELQGRVNDMAADNKLTGVEKQSAKKDWDIINSEFPYLVDQAGKYQINTDAYRQSYYNLSNYLNVVMRAQGEPITTMSGENLTTVGGELIYTMGSINLEATVNIDGNTFRSMFQAYNNSRVVLSKAITDKAKELADKAQSDADKAQSDANKAQADADKVIKEVSDIVSDNILTPPEKQSLKQQLSIISSEQLTLIGQANKYGIPTKPLNDSYTNLDNYMAKFFVDMTINQIANGNEVRLLYKNYYVAKTNLLKSITDKGKDETDKKPSTFINPIAIPPTGAKEGDIWIPSDQSVVFGYVGGNWVLKGDNTQTVVDKGLLTSGTVAVSSDPALGLEKAKAGMTAAGTGDSAVRFWAGSEKNNNTNAPYMVLESGKLISKDAEITGTVKANKGEIGEYYIAEGGLRWSKNSTSKSISFSPNMFTSNLPGPAGGSYNVFLHLKMPLSNPYNRPIFVEGCSEFYGQMVVSGSIMTRGFQMNITDSTVNLTSSRYLFENDILGLSNKNDILVHCITPGLKLYLPKLETISALTDLTTYNFWTMRLTIVGKSTSTQSFYVEGGTDATILDNDAQATQFVNLAAGDVLEFLLYHDKGASTYRAQVLNFRNK